MSLEQDEANWVKLQHRQSLARATAETIDKLFPLVAAAGRTLKPEAAESLLYETSEQLRKLADQIDDELKEQS